MRIRWTPAAAADLTAIYDYLKEHEPHQARSTIVELRQGIRLLKQFPRMGRAGRQKDTRELLHKRLPHIVVYRLKDHAIEILHVVHPARDWQ